MDAPRDDQLTKLQIRLRRAAAERMRVDEEAQARMYEARRRVGVLEQQLGGRLEQLGRCRICEKPLSECEGHVGWALGTEVDIP